MKKTIWLVVLTSGLAIALTITSLRYVHPLNCEKPCFTTACPPKTCQCGEQTVGFPFAIVRDEGCSGSPVSSWGKVTSSDYITSFSLQNFLLNLLVYSFPAFLLVIFISKCFKAPRKSGRQSG